MMAARRCVVIREVEAWRRKAGPREVLLAYLANPSPETTLILCETAPAPDKQREWEPDADLVNRSWAVEFQPLEPDRVPRWLAHHARRLGITFGEGAAEHLAAATGYDLGTLRSELEKLAGLSDAGPITRDRVGELVGVRHGETLDDWVEAVLGDEPARALEIGARVLGQSGMSAVKMVTALGTGLVGVRLARSHYDRGSRGGALERTLLERFRQIRPFGLGDWKLVARHWSRWAEAWPAARLRSGLRAALDADMALKDTRVSDEAAVVTDLVLHLAVRRYDGTTVSSTPTTEGFLAHKTKQIASEPA
jgi:DNA polymerase III delta subunit